MCNTMRLLTANIDGGSRPNPGPAGYAAIIRHGQTLEKKLSQYIGKTTNNVAEYSGLIAALKYAVETKADGLFVYSDSELLVKQMTGVYSVKKPELLDLWADAQAYASQLTHFGIEHVYREQNSEADDLYNQCLDLAKLTGKY